MTRANPASGFDPYHKWLGIPPAEQPANYYRLLGVQPFEGDADVLASAADRQMAHVKSFAAGPYSAQSQQLLDELARARVCLLNATSKRSYDADLRRENEDAANESRVASAAAHRVGVDQQPEHAHFGTLSGAVAQVCPDSGPPLLNAHANGQTAVPFPATETDWAHTARSRLKPTRRHRQRYGIPSLVVLLLLALVTTFFLLNNSQQANVAVDNDQDKRVQRTPVKLRRLSSPQAGLSAPPVQLRKTLADPGAETSRPVRESLDTHDAPTEKRHADLSQALLGDNRPTSAPPSAPEQLPDRQAPTLPHKEAAEPALPKAERSLSFTLDLSRPVMKIRLGKAPHQGTTTTIVTIEQIANLKTPHTMLPSSGVVAQGQPVEILLPQFEMVRIRLTVQELGDAVFLRVAPRIDTAFSEHLDFTGARLRNAYRSFQRRVRVLAEQLLSLKAEQVKTETWLASVGIKSLAAVGAAKNRLLVLKKQIPALEQQMEVAREAEEMYQRLADLGKQIHNNATVTVRIEWVGRRSVSDVLP